METDDSGGSSEPLSEESTHQLSKINGDPLICDGLLCSILHRTSSIANEEELISAIVRDISEPEILLARTKLFIFFDKNICSVQKKPILQIKRTTVDRNVRDIVTKLVKVDKTLYSKVFCMPWDYKLEPFDTDSSKRSKKVEAEIACDVDEKINALEAKMKEQNKALVELFNSKFSEVLKNMSGSSSTYAAAAGGTNSVRNNLETAHNSEAVAVDRSRLSSRNRVGG